MITFIEDLKDGLEEMGFPTILALVSLALLIVMAMWGAVVAYSVYLIQVPGVLKHPVALLMVVINLVGLAFSILALFHWRDVRGWNRMYVICPLISFYGPILLAWLPLKKEVADWRALVLFLVLVPAGRFGYLLAKDLQRYARYRWSLYLMELGDRERQKLAEGSK